MLFRLSNVQYQLICRWCPNQYHSVGEHGYDPAVGLEYLLLIVDVGYMLQIAGS